MSANTFGTLFRVHSFGESHGSAMGAVIDGCPAGVPLDLGRVQKELGRRRPGGSPEVSARRETDQVELLSGVFEGRTLGTPLAFLVHNQDARSQDYNRETQRPGHADDVWLKKFGHSDYRGGGRASGRETLSRVIGGAVARMVMEREVPELSIVSFARSLGPFELAEEERQEFLKMNEAYPADSFAARFPSPRRRESLTQALSELKEKGDSWGGVGEIVIRGAPAGLGQPVFRKLKSDLTAALMSVGAASAVELGDGLHQAERSGVNFHGGSSQVYGGIRGGISTGEDIVLRVHVKPTSSILDVAKKGRHDPCILIRALPVFEAMTALVLVDHLLWRRLDR